ncbi:MAG TPA: nucleotide disphospho-sugar-binding domain-containing protein, partial [Solirubrobacteraceae bacterium]|nr:nucleotide disphospho-sugar-binding domain-containing protein [Solirubrobacteraceae bacterium]
ARSPHVVVHDILTLAPALAAELQGIPRATLIPHLYPVSEPGFPPYSVGARKPRTALGSAFWSAFTRPLKRGLEQGRAELNEARRLVGLPPTERLHGGLSPDLCLVATFPQLEYPREWPDSVRVVGPLLWEPPVPGPPPLPSGAGPLVLLAPSTSHDAGQRLLMAGIEGLAGTGARVLASTDHRAPARALRADAGATRLVSWLSYAQAMPYADAVVCHAGHGTLARALCCGAPVVAIPHSGDMAENAARLDWAGAGVRLSWRLLNATTLRLAVARALDPDQPFVGNARELAAWASANDGPTTAANLVEELGRRA